MTDNRRFDQLLIRFGQFQGCDETAMTRTVQTLFGVPPPELSEDHYVALGRLFADIDRGNHAFTGGQLVAIKGPWRARCDCRLHADRFGTTRWLTKAPCCGSVWWDHTPASGNDFAWWSRCGGVQISKCKNGHRVYKTQVGLVDLHLVHNGNVTFTNDQSPVASLTHHGDHQTHHCAT